MLNQSRNWKERGFQKAIKYGRKTNFIGIEESCYILQYFHVILKPWGLEERIPLHVFTSEIPRVCPENDYIKSLYIKMQLVEL